MAQKLSVQIALEGGAEIERQLADIGTAGQKAFADITKSADQVGGFRQLKPEEVTAKLKDMGVTGVDAIDKIQAAVKQAGKLETMVAGITSVETGMAALAKAAPIVGAVIVGAFALATKAATAFANSVNKVSDEAAQLGVSIRKLDQFRAGLEQAGISAQGISTALAQVQSNADKLSLEQVKRDAQDVQKAIDRGVGGGQVVEQFNRLTQTANQFTEAGKAARAELVKMGEGVPGTTFEDVQKLGVELAKLKGLGIDIKVSDDAVTQAQKIIVALAKMPDQAKAAQIAMQQFGAAGPEMVAGLRTGSITVDQFRERFGTLTAEQEAAANKMRQSTEQMSADWERFKVQVGAPIAIAGMAAVTAVFDAIRGGIATTVREFVALGSAINSVATVGARVIGGLVQIVTTIGTAIAGVVSAIGSITWDAISGAGVAAWNALTDAIGPAVTAVGNFVSKIATIVWDTISGLGVAAWNALTGAIQGTVNKVLEYIGLKDKAGTPLAGGAAIGGAGGGIGRAASGGLLGGRGTGTSDSNLAWVSRGEYVMPASAVRQPGVLAFLEALRRSGGIPSFAKGGQVGGGSASGIAQTAYNNSLQIFKAINSLMSTINTTANQWSKLIPDTLFGWFKTLDRIAQDVTNNSDQVTKALQGLGGKASGGLLGGRGTGTSDSNLAWVSRGEYIMPARAVKQPGVLAFLERLRRLGNLPSFAKGGAVGGLERLFYGADEALNEMVEDTRVIFDQITTLIEDARFRFRGAAAGFGAARGGLLGGRGSGTSDSNLAWVSRGEYVTPARAVAQPGVLAFLEALRRSGGNLGRVLDGMGRFALGGMVPRMPAFAAGGLAGGSNVTIQFPGLPPIGGLRASSDVVEQLQKAAALAQVRSGGRKPSRYS